MRKPSPRDRRWLGAAATPVGMLISALVVWMSSYAAFTATTESPSNSWQTSQLKLTNDNTSAGTFAQSTRPMFSFDSGANPDASKASDIFPGASGSRCINVKNEFATATTATNPIKFYAVLPAGLASNTLAKHIDLVVQESTAPVPGGKDGDCGTFGSRTVKTVYSGKLSGLQSGYDAATRVVSQASNFEINTTWSYKITWTLPSSAPQEAAKQDLGNVQFAWGIKAGAGP